MIQILPVFYSTHSGTEVFSFAEKLKCIFKAKIEKNYSRLYLNGQLETHNPSV
jgi:hypothetical protein